MCPWVAVGELIWADVKGVSKAKRLLCTTAQKRIRKPHRLFLKHIMFIIACSIFGWRKPCNLMKGIGEIMSIGKAQTESNLGNGPGGFR